MTYRELALNSLAEIARHKPGTAYASRRGVCAGTYPEAGRSIMFRRVGERIDMEIWKASGGLTAVDLGPDVQARAALMLDNCCRRFPCPIHPTSAPDWPLRSRRMKSNSSPGP